MNYDLFFLLKLSPRSVIQILSPSCHLITFDAHAKNFLRISRMDVSEKSRFSLPSRCISHALNLPRYFSRFLHISKSEQIFKPAQISSPYTATRFAKMVWEKLGTNKVGRKLSFPTYRVKLSDNGYFITPLLISSSSLALPSSDRVARKFSLDVARFSSSETRFFLFALAIPLAT